MSLAGLKNRSAGPFVDASDVWKLAEREREIAGADKYEIDIWLAGDRACIL